MKNEWKHFELDSKEYEYTYSMSGDLKISYRKREVEPVIKKSGETWVASFEGVDYLCRNNTQSQPPFFYYEGDNRTIPSTWKPFSEIEITDTIAKLRPMMVADTEAHLKLLYVDMGRLYMYVCVRLSDNDVDSWRDLRLATVKDLEE